MGLWGNIEVCWILCNFKNSIVICFNFGENEKKKINFFFENFLEFYLWKIINIILLIRKIFFFVRKENDFFYFEFI